MKYIAWMLLLLCINGLSYGDEPIYIDNILDALSFAESTKKDLLIIFTADWCPSCSVMKKDISNSQELLKDCVICYIDYDKNKDLVKEYKVRIIPDYFMIKNKIETKRKIGYRSLPEFKAWLQK